MTKIEILMHREIKQTATAYAQVAGMSARADIGDEIVPSARSGARTTSANVQQKMIVYTSEERCNIFEQRHARST